MEEKTIRFKGKLFTLSANDVSIYERLTNNKQKELFLMEGLNYD